MSDENIPRLRVAITGASGLIGTELCTLLEREGAQVLRFVRCRPVRPNEVYWDGVHEIDTVSLEGMDGVVNLAGANVAARRWSREYKQLIINSRVQGTQLIATKLARLKEPPSVFVSASAAGFYGNRAFDDELDESAPAGKGFLAEVCQAWEAAAHTASEAGIRTVHPRFGAVISAQGGVLRRMLPPFKLGLGGRLGSGRQAMNWIALADAARLIAWLIGQPDITGPVNAVAPQCVTNAELTDVLGRVLSRPALTAVPAAVVKAMYGEMGEELLLSGAHLVPRKVLNGGFGFIYPEFEMALRAELGDGEKGS